jgi:hypothetical protein
MLSTGRIGRAWATNYSTASRVPLHASLGAPNDDYPSAPASSAARLPAPLSHAAYSFVHGGLAPTYARLTPVPSAINALGADLLRKLYARGPVPPHPPAPYPGLPADATEAEEELYGTGGPLWYRGWALGSEDDVCAVVDGVLARTGTRRMVMGHTPDFEVRLPLTPRVTRVFLIPASWRGAIITVLTAGAEDRVAMRGQDPDHRHRCVARPVSGGAQLTRTRAQASRTRTAVCSRRSSSTIRSTGPKTATAGSSARSCVQCTRTGRSCLSTKHGACQHGRCGCARYRLEYNIVEYISMCVRVWARN